MKQTFHFSSAFKAFSHIPADPAKTHAAVCELGAGDCAGGPQSNPLCEPRHRRLGGGGSRGRADRAGRVQRACRAGRGTLGQTLTLQQLGRPEERVSPHSTGVKYHHTLQNSPHCKCTLHTTTLTGTTTEAILFQTMRMPRACQYFPARPALKLRVVHKTADGAAQIARC